MKALALTFLPGTAHALKPQISNSWSPGSGSRVYGETLDGGGVDDGEGAVWGSGLSATLPWSLPAAHWRARVRVHPSHLVQRYIGRVQPAVRQVEHVALGVAEHEVAVERAGARPPGRPHTCASPRGAATAAVRKGRSRSERACLRAQHGLPVVVAAVAIPPPFFPGFLLRALAVLARLPFLAARHGARLRLALAPLLRGLLPVIVAPVAPLL
eukprot:350910-Chlamydomonas_euryale.AAC.4